MAEMKHTDGGPAFPNGLKGEVKLAGNRYDGAYVPEYDAKFGGMTLRDYFAASALPHALSASSSQSGCYDYIAATLAAYEIADAMLAERSKATSHNRKDGRE